MSVLTIVDVTGTQKYIFGTNKLRENIGASEIVAQATDRWVREFVVDEEVIYCGGGNALLLFDDLTKAKAFARKYTRKLLQAAPNLDVVIKHREFDFENAKLQAIAEETRRDLNEKKANRRTSAPLVGLGVSVQCISTGGVASFDPLDLAKNEDSQGLFEALLDKYRGKEISAESFAKIDKAKSATQRLKAEIFSGIALGDLGIPSELDDLGRTEGEASFIAVVHTDGNGMGDRIKKHGRDAKDNNEWKKRMRDLSKSIQDTNLRALKTTLEVLHEHIIRTKKNDKDIWIFESGNGDSFELSFDRKREKQFFPLRPLIFGGDDLTFVCDGRIALAITAFYLKELARKDEKGEYVHKLDDGKPLYARAGIAIVKSHYPFARAYELAEDLAKSAKQRIKELDDNKNEAYALDWHVALSGLFGSIEEIRRREYTVAQGQLKLNMRPLSLENEGWQYWQNFEDVIREFQTSEKWKGKRNKVKALREALRGGSEATKKFLQGYQIGKLPEIIGRPGIENDGWNVSNVCGYFDAIEMLDLYFPLRAKEGKG